MWLVGGILLLLLVIAASIVYARMRAQRYLLGLPGKLGIDIKQESDGFTYSQSVGGKTVFTVHAAKEIQHTDGKITLHDVGIVLYGRKQDRADRIHGNEFEYDQASGVMRAIGEVYIDLAAPVKAAASEADAQMVHVKTSGLIFHQRERSAATDQAIEFMAGGLSGTAVGALYDSASGVIVLQSAVQVSGLRKGQKQSAVLRASRAELDQPGKVLHLQSARYVETGDRGSQNLAAEHADVYLTESGQAQRIEADGAVTLGGDGQGSIAADRMKLQLNAEGQPHAGEMAGRVRFMDGDAGKIARGEAGQAAIDFDAAGRPTRVLLTGGVEMDQTEAKSERRLLAARVLLGLSGGGKERVQLRAVAASGGVPAAGGRGAWLRLLDKEESGSTTTDVFGETLTGRFAAGGMKPQLTGLSGRGGTLVERAVANRAGAIEATDKSTGDLLEVAFSADAKGQVKLSSARQSGHVETRRDAVRKVSGNDQAAGAHEVEQARSEVAVYDAESDQVSLTGEVQVADAASSLSADRVTFDRRTGGSVAEGAVRVSYREAGSRAEPVHVAEAIHVTEPIHVAEPIHLTAAKAVANQATGVTEFFAGDGAAARMWQGGSQVEAPVLTFERTARRMVAHGVAGADEVKAVLLESPAVTTRTGTNKRPGLVRITSREMTYADAQRLLEFTGKVGVRDALGSMQTNAASVYLAPAVGGAGGVSTGIANMGAGIAGAGMLAGKVERVIGQGAVELEQPGRRASGERIVYTASDGMFVLTGTKTMPPKLVDESRGTVSGASLRFRSGDDSVVVSGVQDGVDDRRVRSETRIRQ